MRRPKLRRADALFDSDPTPGLTATGDEVSESEVLALWQSAKGAYAPITPPDVATVTTEPIHLAERRDDAHVARELWQIDVGEGEQTALFAA
jgi:hypothetical protein